MLTVNENFQMESDKPQMPPVPPQPPEPRMSRLITLSEALCPVLMFSRGLLGPEGLVLLSRSPTDLDSYFLNYPSIFVFIFFSFFLCDM